MDRKGPDLLEALKRYWALVVLFTLAGVVVSGAAAVLLRGSNAYAEGTVALTSPSSVNVLAPGAQGDATLGRYANQRALFMEGDAVLGVTAQQIPTMTVDRLRTAVTVRPSTTSTSLVVHVTAGTPREAVALVDALVSAYRQETAKQVSDRTSAALDSLAEASTRLRQTLSANPTQAIAASSATALAEITRQASALQADSAAYGDGVDFVQAASPQSSGQAAFPLRQLALGGLLGLAVGGVVAWLRADRHRLLVHAADVGPALGTVELGVLPHWREPVAPPVEHAPITRYARDVLAPLSRDGAPKVVLLAGATRGSGSTSLALGMTCALAAEGLHVLLVDADPATRGATTALGVDPGAPGLLEAVLLEHQDPRELVLEVAVGEGLKAALLPAGSDTGGDRQVSTAGLRRLVTDLRQGYDAVVVDARLRDGDVLPPAVVSLADAVVVVVRAGLSVEALAELRKLLEVNNAPVAGHVFNEG